MTIDLRDVALEGGDHVVQFYDREGDLFEVVGQHLARVARAQETSIVIASETHRQGFEAELELAGIDVVEAHRAGGLVMFDAGATMTQFMVAGQIDQKAFHFVLRGILDDAFEMGRQVHVYGEMVALLWDAGDVMAAVELESLWNDLIGSQHFSLLCGYPSGSVAGPEHAEALLQICHLHSSVVRRISALEAPYPPSAVSEMTADFGASQVHPGRRAGSCTTSYGNGARPMKSWSMMRPLWRRSSRRMRSSTLGLPFLSVFAFYLRNN